MGKRLYCINCRHSLLSNRKKYCSNYCYIEFLNKQNRQIRKVDKWGRIYLSCNKCKKRLRKLENRGTTKFKCFNCLSHERHKPLPDSMFMERSFKNGKEIIKVILEITEGSGNWHYLNGKAIRGFRKAKNNFSSLIHRLEHKNGFVPID